MNAIAFSVDHIWPNILYTCSLIGLRFASCSVWFALPHCVWLTKSSLIKHTHVKGRHEVEMVSTVVSMCCTFPM